MKKIFIISFLLSFTSLAIAQNIAIGPKPIQKPKLNSSELRAAKKLLAQKTTASNSDWFCYGNSAQSGSQEYNWNYLFPDSLGYGEFVAGLYSPVWIHHLAEVIDIKSPLFFNNPSSWAPILQVDSIAIGYGYTRTQTTVTDTLIITLFAGSIVGDSKFEPGFLLNTSGAYGSADTVCYKRLGYNQTTNTIADAVNNNLVPSGQQIYKILLNQNDTSSIGIEKAFALTTPFISNSRLIGADIQFKPGYTYLPGEHISNTANAFKFISIEENGNMSGNGTYMMYYDCNSQSTFCDYSSSHVITKEIRYNNAGSWNNSYVPAIIYPQAWKYEHHLISFHLTDNFCLANSQFSIFPDSITPGRYYAYNNSTATGSITYLWDFGDGTSSTQQYPAHQYAIPGQYVICLTTSATSGTTTCSNTYCDSSSVHKMTSGFLMSQFNVINPQIITNISQTEKSLGINAYPNPISDELYIELNNKDYEKLNYVLTDAVGRVILSNNFDKDKTIINTSQLSKGFYTLSIINKNGEGIKSIKIIK